MIAYGVNKTMMHKIPLVSVIIPTRNSERTLNICLSSIKNQTYKNIELIVVDNNSTDKTKEIARTYTDLVFNKGPERHVQRNYGFRMARGKYIVFIDSDMELMPHLLEEALMLCEREKFDAIILPEISVGSGFLAECRMLEKRCYLNDELMETPNRFMKKKVYECVGGYDKDLISGEDFDLGDRIKQRFRVGRARSFIKHHEVRSFSETMKKHFYYGKHMKIYFKKAKVIGLKRFFIVRPAYIRNWKLFARDPVHGLALIIIKILQYMFALAGFLTTLGRN